MQRNREAGKGTGARTQEEDESGCCHREGSKEGIGCDNAAEEEGEEDPQKPQPQAPAWECTEVRSACGDEEDVGLRQRRVEGAGSGGVVV